MTETAAMGASRDNKIIIFNRGICVCALQTYKMAKP